MNINKVKKGDSFSIAIRFPLILLILISVFVFPKPKLNQLNIVNTAKIAMKPKIYKGGKAKKYIRFKIEKNNNFLVIDNHNLYNSNKEAIINEIEIGNEVTLGLRGEKVFYLLKGDIELTNLKKANEARKQVQIWGITIPLLLLIATLQNYINNKKIKLIYLVFILSLTLVVGITLYKLIGINNLVN